MRDPYEVLGVDRKASPSDIKSAFRQLAKKLHPDANKNDPKAATRFAEMNAAYEILGDDDKRKAFDRGEIDAEGKPRFQGFGRVVRPGRPRRRRARRGLWPRRRIRDFHLSARKASPGAPGAGGPAAVAPAAVFGGFEDILRKRSAAAARSRGGSAVDASSRRTSAAAPDVHARVDGLAAGGGARRHRSVCVCRTAKMSRSRFRPGSPTGSRSGSAARAGRARPAPAMC